MKLHPARLLQQRLPRETFTRKLRRICASLDERSRCSVPQRMRYTTGIRIAEMQVMRVWVAGSYARGALLCGDLDLVVDAGRVGGIGFPSAREIARVLFGPTPLVRFFSGLPMDNSAGVELPEAKLVWETGWNWSSAIESIVPDPAAGPAPRITDVLPLRPLQLAYPDILWLEKFAQDHEAEVWASEFQPLPRDQQGTLPSGELAQVLSFLSAPKRSILTLYAPVLQSMGHHLRGTVLDPAGELRIGSARALLGRPSVWRAVSLLRSGACDSVLMLPAPSREGPNGVWQLRRGQRFVAGEGAACTDQRVV